MDNIDIDKASLEWIDQNGFERLPMYAGAREFVEELSEICDVSIVTARIGDYQQEFDATTKVKIKNDTYSWFRKHHILSSRRIRFSHNKVDLCVEEGISIIVEDKLSTALHAAASGMQAVVVDRAWNQYKNVDNVHRSHSYSELINIIKRLVSE